MSLEFHTADETKGKNDFGGRNVIFLSLSIFSLGANSLQRQIAGQNSLQNGPFLSPHDNDDNLGTDTRKPHLSLASTDIFQRRGSQEEIKEEQICTKNASRAV